MGIKDELDQVDISILDIKNILLNFDELKASVDGNEKRVISLLVKKIGEVETNLLTAMQTMQIDTSDFTKRRSNDHII